MQLGDHFTDLSQSYLLESPSKYPNVGFMSQTMTLQELEAKLKETYCNKIGYEFYHLENTQERNWLISKIESKNPVNFSAQEKKQILEKLIYAHELEAFLSLKFPHIKKFGIEGLESAIPGIQEIVNHSCDLGVDTIGFQVSHRGKLNVLANILNKPVIDIFREFRSFTDGGYSSIFHLAWTYDQKLEMNQKTVHLTLVSNAAHLDSSNPALLGKIKAKQYYHKDLDQSKHTSISIHGDSSFSGQGINYETIQSGTQPQYSVGGTVHVVFNNQIGFTTQPNQYRSNKFTTNVGKCFQIPIFHVNAESIEAVVRICRLASEFKAEFKKDVIVDIIGYRLRGHNEIDQPRFTQPKIYDVIDKKEDQMSIYKNQLFEEGVISDSEFEEMRDRVVKYFEGEFNASKNLELMTDIEPYKGLSVWREWATHVSNQECVTGLPREILKSHLSKFSVQSNLMNMELAETVAYSSLVQQYHIKMTRGREMRHPVSEIELVNRPFNEYGSLSFEFGYSQENPYSLVVWEHEASLSNNAQIVIDQFISGSDDKWHRKSGIVLKLLYSDLMKYMERFLQLSDETDVFIPNLTPEQKLKELENINIQIVTCTNPSNYFHVLRRQCLRSLRKPLILFMNSSQLVSSHHLESKLTEFDENSAFQPLIVDSNNVVGDVKELIFCSGVVYFSIMKSLKTSAVVVRIEELCPLPFEMILDLIKKHPNSKISWHQFENKSNGAWPYLRQRFYNLLNQDVDFVQEKLEKLQRE